MNSNYSNSIVSDENCNEDIVEHFLTGPGLYSGNYQKNFNSVQTNKEKYSLQNFKRIIKREHISQLNQYKKSLDEKIELLKTKINKETFMTENNSLTINKKKQLFNRIANQYCKNSTKPNYNHFKQKILEKEEICIHFLQFLNSNELFRIVNCKKEIKKMIINVIINKLKEKIIPKFKLKYSIYSPVFDSNNISYYLVLKNYKKLKRTHLRIILLIKAKINPSINTNIAGKYYQIGFTQSSSLRDNEKALNTFQFEILRECKDINNNLHQNNNYSKQKHFWINREKTDFYFDDLNRSHYNPVQKFHQNDIAVFNISIFSELGLIDFNNFHWIQMKEMQKVNSNNLQCEVEKMINCWGDLNQLKDYAIISKSIHDIFKEFFEIISIRFDDIGYFIFKITLKAKKAGIIKAKENDYIGMDITIGNVGDVIENEVKKNGLIYDEINKLNINVCDIIEFYYSKSK